jgi:hypothetical protein
MDLAKQLSVGLVLAQVCSIGAVWQQVASLVRGMTDLPVVVWCAGGCGDPAEVAGAVSSMFYPDKT